MAKIDTIDKQPQEKLFRLWKKYEILFDQTLGKLTGAPYKIELKPGVTPYHAKPFPVLKAYEQTLRAKVKRLCKIGFLCLHPLFCFLL